MSGAGARSSSSVGTRDRTSCVHALQRRRRRERREQIDRLARAQDFDRDDLARASDTLRRAFSAARHAHADVVFLVRRGRDRVDRRPDARALSSPTPAPPRSPAPACSPDFSPPSRVRNGRQAAERRIDEPIGPPLADRRQRAPARRRAGRPRWRSARRGSCRPRRCRRCRRTPSGCRWRVGLDRDASRARSAAPRAPRRAPARAQRSE